MLLRDVPGIIEGGAAFLVCCLGIAQQSGAAMVAGNAKSEPVTGAAIEQAFVEEGRLLVTGAGLAKRIPDYRAPQHDLMAQPSVSKNA